MNKYDTVIFDLDGTLLDTLGDLTDSLNDTLQRHGFPPRSMAEVRYFVGNGVERLLELALPDGRDTPGFDACVAEFRAHYAAHMDEKTAPYDGIPALLAALTARGCRLAIVSNKFDAAVKALSRRYFGDGIRVAIGESASVARKPAPDTVLKALAELGAAPARTLYVGDSEVDVATAHHAGLRCVGVTWGFRPRTTLEEAGADYLIDAPQELLGLLDA